MKNKPITYFLILGVVCIWGGIGYRFFRYYKNSTPIIQSHTAFLTEFDREKNLFKKETYELLLNYKDPFLGKESFFTNNKFDNTNTYSQNIISPVREPNNWISIDYLGIVKNRISHRKIAILKIGDKQYNMEGNQEERGVKVITIKDDSVQLQYLGNKKYFKKKKIKE